MGDGAYQGFRTTLSGRSAAVGTSRLHACKSRAGLVFDNGFTDVSAVVAVIVSLFVVAVHRVGQGFPAGFTVHSLDKLFPPRLEYTARSLSRFGHAKALLRLVSKAAADGVEPL